MKPLRYPFLRLTIAISLNVSFHFVTNENKLIAGLRVCLLLNQIKQLIAFRYYLFLRFKKIVMKHFRYPFGSFRFCIFKLEALAFNFIRDGID